MTAIRKNLAPALAIVGLAIIAVLVAAYILAQMHVRVPLLSKSPTTINVAMNTAESVTPGQGVQVQVAGVRIGEVGQVTLTNGHANLAMQIDPKFSDLIHTDAHALLRPRTGLKDMYIQVMPGSHRSPIAKAGYTIPMENTATDVDVDQILQQLDARTRDYVTLLANGAGTGLKGEGSTLAEVFRRYEPTARDLALVNGSVGKEEASLRRVIHGLALLNRKLAQRPQDLTQLVGAAGATFNAFASQDRNLQATVADLPATLRQATDTLNKVTPFAQQLGPAATALQPAVRALQVANAKLKPFAHKVEPIVRTQLRPFARTARPVVRDLKPTAQNLNAAIPDLQRSAVVLNHFVNMLGYNKNGREGPDVVGRDEGYLFWLGWLGHQTVNLFNVDDANGPMRPIFLTGTCGTLTGLVTGEPLLEYGLNLSPVLASTCGNPATPSININQLIQQITGLLPTDLQGLIPHAQIQRDFAARAKKEASLKP